MADLFDINGNLIEDKLCVKPGDTEDANHGLMCPADKKKLDGIAAGANNYTHPSSHAASMITQDSTHRFVTDTEKTAWNAAKTHADSTHAPSNAEVNQNAFSNVKVGTTTVAADSKTDTLTLEAGSNVTITPDATNDKITITAKDTVYTHPTYTSKSSGLYKITVDSTGHVSATTAVAKADITGLGIPGSDTVYTHPSHTAKTSGLYKVTVDGTGHISAATAVAKADITALGIPGENTVYTHPTSGITAGTYKSVTVNAQGHVTSGTNPTTLAGYGITDAAKSSDLTSHTGNKSNPHGVTKAQVGLGNVTNDAQVKRTEMGVANGVATLDDNGTVPSSQLPSYVDDVIEGYLYNSKFYKESAHTTQITGEGGKIYVDLSSGKTYRWSGSAFSVISETLALGETSSTAYAGNKGKANADAITTMQTKLNGIEDGANKYTHPSYTAKSSGLYKITVDGTGHVSAATAVAKADITGLGIPGSDTKYTHPAYTAKSSGLYKITVDSTGHVSGATAVAKADITALGIPASDTNTWRPVQVNGTALESTETLNIKAGTNVTLSESAGAVTITSKDTVYTHPSYTARTGVPTANATLTFGGTFTVTQPTSDATGHVTALNSRTYTMPSDRLFTTLVPTGTAIPASANLNTTTYMKVGRYYCSQTATAKTITNCPVDAAFMMEVYSPLSTTIDNETTGTWVYRLRKITHYSSGMQYIQFCSVGETANTWTYGSWKVVPQVPFTLDSTDNNGGNATVGSATKPVYVNNGTITACTNTLGKSVPSDAVFTDTKVTNTLGTTTKAYITGTTSATTNTGTQIFDTGVYLDTTAGRLTATSFKTGSGVISYDSSLAAIKFTFV